MVRKNKLLIGCLALLLVLSVGYALFSETITINGTATAKGSFDITTTCVPGYSSELFALGIPSADYEQAGFANSICDVNDNTKDAILNKIKDAFSSATILADIYFVDENIASSNYDTYDEFTSYIQNKQYNKKLFLIKENVDEYSKLEWSNK